jgi:hypothetical protein
MKYTSEEIYNQRIGRVVGSAVGAILGIDPTRSRAEVLRDMLDAKNGLPRSFPYMASDHWELMCQYEALLQFMSATGHSAWPASFCVHDSFDWLGVNPDAFVEEDGAILIIHSPFEFRDVRHPVFASIAEQPLFAVQAHVQMYVTGRSSCYFWQWTPYGHKLELIEYEPYCIVKTFPVLDEFQKEYVRLCG